MALKLTGHIESLGFVGDKPALYREDKYKVGDRVIFIHDPKEEEYFIEEVNTLPAEYWVKYGHTQMVRMSGQLLWSSGAMLIPN